MFFNNSDIEKLLQISLLASRKVVEIYNSREFRVQLKKDKSPLTLADQLSQKVIIESLKKFFPKIPIISEESKTIAFVKRKNWEYFWLVDPLDGTKEFIQKNGEFTVNIALVHKTSPVFGVIALPAQNQLYFGQKDKGAFKQDKQKRLKPIRVKKPSSKKVIVRSRSHPSQREDELIALFKNPEIIYAGSSLKFCRVAEGLADLYLRAGPTMEWDTAAGQIVAESAGALVTNFEGKSFSYNKENLTNPGFICAANQGILHNLLPDKSL